MQQKRKFTSEVNAASEQNELKAYKNFYKNNKLYASLSAGAVSAKAPSDKKAKKGASEP